MSALRFALHQDGVVHHTTNAHTVLHAGLVHKVVVPLDAPVEFAFADGRHEVTQAPLFVPSGLEHAIGSEGHTATIFIDSQSELGRALRAECGSVEKLREERWWRGLGQELLSGLDTSPSAADQADLVEAAHNAIRARLLPRPKAPSMDARVERTLRALQADDDYHFSLNDLARSVALSPSRLRHLFKLETGTTLRRFALWSRTQDAFVGVLHGEGFAEAAYRVGFSDQAHFARSIRKLLGQPPSYIRRP